MPPADSIDGQLFPSIGDSALSANPSEIEREVMELFEQFRTPLLRYTLSFEIPLHDAEEVVQETFLSLFRHLQRGRSRRNLRGWIFRVAHNLALKQLYANQRSHSKTVPTWRSPKSSVIHHPVPKNSCHRLNGATDFRLLFAFSRKRIKVASGCVRRVFATGK